MAIVSLIALLVALAIVLLLAAQPWAPAMVAPQLSLAPGIGVGLGDAVKLPSTPQLAVSPAQEVVRGGTGLVATAAAPEEGAGGPQFGVSAARVVVSAAPVSPAAPPEQVAPKLPSPPPPADVPPPLPVSSPPPEPPPQQAPAVTGAGGEMQGPIASGGVPGGGETNVIQVCEGDDFTLSLSPGAGSGEGEALPADPVRHDLAVYFAAGSEAAVLYLVFLDGLPVEMGEALAPSEPGHGCAQIDFGPLVGEPIEAGTEVHVEGVALGESTEPVLP